MTSAQRAIDAMMRPERVAIVGASNDRSKPGGRIMGTLMDKGYLGTIMPVNPGVDSIGGVESLPALTSYGDGIDLAVIAVPSAAVKGVIRDAGRSGIPCAIITSSGFAEAGGIGRKSQDDLVSFARTRGVRICGPNSIGVMSPVVGLFATFTPAATMEPIPRGAIGFVTQSGALGGSILSRAIDDGIGVSAFISSGNEADLGTPDFVDYLVRDSETNVIALFLEGVRDGVALRGSLGRAAEAGKPVVVYKNGTTDEGTLSVESHTGVLAGPDRIYDAVFRQTGAVRVNRVEELMAVAHALSVQPLGESRRVGVVSTSGGACTVIADGCVNRGLELAQLSPATLDNLKARIPSFGRAENPVDVTAQVASDPASFLDSIRLVADDDAVDSLIVVMTTIADPLGTEIAEGLVPLLAGMTKPVVVVWTVAESLAKEGISVLRSANIPVYSQLEDATLILGALKHVARHRRSVEREVGRTPQ